ncbi:hypothetical protein BC332_01452 [Capsicum chinense]|nr:hypothetical protein BC332_01452 [Capsicum chinense]
MAIHGIGGIGKSTLVKTAYNLNFDKFDGNNFLADVNKTLERDNGLVSLQNEIEEKLDHLRRIKSGGDLDSFKIDQIEKLKMDLKLLRIFVKYSHFLWSNSVVKITKKARRIVKMLCGDFIGIPDECKTNLDLKRLESQLLKVIDGNTSLSYNSELNGSDLSKYMDCLRENLNDKKVAAIAGDVLYVIQKLLPGSINEDETSGTGDIYSMRVLEKTKDLKRDLLQKIFSQVIGSMDKGEKDDILTDKLRKNLIGKRYLIVLDDMWDGIEWDNLRLCFLDSGKHCAENGLFSFSYKMKMLPPQGWSILKENLFEDYYVQTAGSKGRVKEEDDDDDSILDYDDDDEDEEATLAEIEEFFGDLGEINGTILQQCVNIDELK